MKLNYLLPLCSLVVFLSCKGPERVRQKSLDEISKKYSKLALEIGQYDNDFIDAYYGAEEWNRNSKDAKDLPYEELKWQSTTLLNQLKSIDDMAFSDLELLRYQFLNKQLNAIRTKLDMMSGKTYPFDVESLRLYDVVAPHIDLVVYDEILIELDNIVPGEGDLTSRYHDYSKGFIIPADKVDKVFQAAISEARKRVSERITLPVNESFELEYVNDKPWSGYNWYKGNAHSLIQINTDLPIYIERAVDLACHEGYPGHHVYNAILEHALVDQLKWQEFQVYPLFSPQSFIAEGTANYGIEMVFNLEERIKFEEEVLFPIAGFDPELAAPYYAIQELRKSLLSAEIQIARAYLNHEIESTEAFDLLKKYLQYEEDRAKQRLSFFDRYRSYVINYSLGNDLIKDYIEEATATEVDSKWELYLKVLSTPRTASTL